MNGGATPGAGQFHAVDQLHTQGLGGFARFVEAFEGIVVGQRQDSHAFFKRTRNQHRGARAPSEAVLWQCKSTFTEVCNLKSGGAFATKDVCYLCRHIQLLALTVKQFIDFIPLLLFFIVYKLDPRVIDLAGHELTFGGIYSATAVLIISSIVVYGAIFISQRKLEKSHG